MIKITIDVTNANDQEIKVLNKLIKKDAPLSQFTRMAPTVIKQKNNLGNCGKPVVEAILSFQNIEDFK